MGATLFDPAKLREKVTEHRTRAVECADASEKEFHVAMARSHLLLSMNAAWITSTDEFLMAVEANERWPQPQLADVAQRDVGRATEL
jgi:hypothetical protein